MRYTGAGRRVRREAGTRGRPKIELNVSAALGLKEALLDIQKEYERKNPNITIVYNLAAAGVLQAQT